jgi:hypothetical protein
MTYALTTLVFALEEVPAMILTMQLVLFCMGLQSLVTGKLPLGKNRVVRGSAARILGVVAMLPFPLALGVGFAVGVIMGLNGRSTIDPSLRWIFIAAEFGVIVLCLIVIYSVGPLVAGRANTAATDYHPVKNPSAIPSWAMYVVLIPIVGGVVYKSTEQQLTNKVPEDVPAVEHQPQGDHDQHWARYEIADAPGQVPATAGARLNNAGAAVYLSDLQEFAWKPGAPGWTFGKAGDLGAPVQQRRSSFFGMSMSKALSMHPPDTGYTRVCYYLGRRAHALHGQTCLSDDDKTTKPNPTRFVVLGDDKLLWRSISARDSYGTSKFDLDVSQVNILELRTYVEAGDSTGSHAVWFNPYVDIKQ